MAVSVSFWSKFGAKRSPRGRMRTALSLTPKRFVGRERLFRPRGRTLRPKTGLTRSVPGSLVFPLRFQSPA